jgi:hypothetical protein
MMKVHLIIRSHIAFYDSKDQTQFTDIKGGEDLPKLGKALLAERQAYEDLLLEKL